MAGGNRSRGAEETFQPDLSDFDAPETEVEPAEPASAAREPRRDDWQRGVVAHLRPLDGDEEGTPVSETHEAAWDAAEPEPTPRSEYRFRGPAGSGWDGEAEDAEAFPEPARSEEPSFPRAARAPAFRDEDTTDADLFVPAGKTSRTRDPFAEDSRFVEDSGRDTGSGSGFPAESLGRRRRASAFPEFDEPANPEEPPRDRTAARLTEALEPRYSDPTYNGDWKSKELLASDEPKVATAAPPSAGSRRTAAARKQAAKRGVRA